MAESDETERLRAKAKALKKECIMAVAQTEQIKKAIRIASTQHQNEPWSAEFGEAGRSTNRSVALGRRDNA
jgi:hypothetical protein